MHKDPDRRYGTAQALADDIRRPWKAARCRRRRYVQVSCPEVSAAESRFGFAASLALLGLFVGGIAAAWQRGVAISKEQEARKRFGDIRELANSFLGELDTELERLPGSTTAREMLARKMLQYLDARRRIRCETPHYSVNSQSHMNG